MFKTSDKQHYNQQETTEKQKLRKVRMREEII